MRGNPQPKLEVWVPPPSEQLSCHVVSCLFTFQGNICVKNSALDASFQKSASQAGWDQELRFVLLFILHPYRGVE